VKKNTTKTKKSKRGITVKNYKSYKEYLESIAGVLDGNEWGADTLDNIAAIVRKAGFTIREV
jgi:hypothetical protein